MGGPKVKSQIYEASIKKMKANSDKFNMVISSALPVIYYFCLVTIPRMFVVDFDDLKILPLSSYNGFGLDSHVGGKMSPRSPLPQETIDYSLTHYVARTKFQRFLFLCKT